MHDVATADNNVSDDETSSYSEEESASDPSDVPRQKQKCIRPRTGSSNKRALEETGSMHVWTQAEVRNAAHWNSFHGQW